MDKSVTGPNGENFLDMLYEMLKDPDVNVVSNCIVVLNEMLNEKGGMAVNRNVIHHLLNRLKGFPEVSERAFWKTSILAMKCAKLLQDII